MAQFTAATASAAAAKSHQSYSKRTAIKQAAELQNACYHGGKKIFQAFSAGKTLAREDALALAALVKGFDSMCNRIRILRNVPLPGSCKPLPKARREKPKNKPPQLSAQVAVGPGG